MRSGGPGRVTTGHTRCGRCRSDRRLHRCLVRVSRVRCHRPSRRRCWRYCTASGSSTPLRRRCVRDPAGRGHLPVARCARCTGCCAPVGRPRRPRPPSACHPPGARKPELVATAPNQVWSWDITKLLGPAKWTYYHLYVILDVYSPLRGRLDGRPPRVRRPGRAADRRDPAPSRRIGPGQLTIHADRGTSMTSKPVALLLADLGVTKSHSRPTSRTTTRTPRPSSRPSSTAPASPTLRLDRGRPRLLPRLLPLVQPRAPPLRPRPAHPRRCPPRPRRRRTPHSRRPTVRLLRHTCVSLLLHLGVAPRVVNEIVGHAALEMTMIVYGHVNLDDQPAALDQLNGLFDAE